VRAESNDNAGTLLLLERQRCAHVARRRVASAGETRNRRRAASAGETRDGRLAG